MIKVLVIGESCTDRFIYGDAERLSPEAPIPVFIPRYVKTNSGMAANVALNFKGLVFDDEYFVDLVTQDTEIFKTRYVEDKSNHPFLRVDEFEDQVKRIIIDDDIVSKINNSDLVIVSDYDKGFLTEEDLIKISTNSKISVLDTKKKLSKEILENHYDFIKLNEKEFAQNYTEDENILKKLVITLGSKGAKYMGIAHPSESPRETVDVSGAGDTFTAAFAYKYHQTKDVSVAITFANKIATRMVSKRGVTVT